MSMFSAYMKNIYIEKIHARGHSIIPNIADGKINMFLKFKKKKNILHEILRRLM